MTIDISDIEDIVARQNAWRQTQTINLIASENTPSEAVRRVQNSDFMGRYAEGHPNEGDKVNRYYQGTRYIDQVERMAQQEILELFHARQADVRPISGNAANTALALGFLRGGDTVIANSTDAGGHISHGPVGVFGRRIQSRGQSLIAGRPNFVNLDEEDEKKYWPAADRGVFPGSSSNHHLHTLPALLVAIREMKAFGRDYALQIVRNAQALGRSLDELGTPVEAREFGYTKSHMIAVSVSQWGGGVEVAKRLEANDIIVNYNMLPGDSDPRNPSGLRIGVPEMTRFGMDERALGELAQLMHDAIRGKNVKSQVNALRGRFTEMKYV